MKILSLFTVMLGLFYIAPTLTYAKVNIFTCEPEWASLAEEIGGDNVKAFSATHAQQDPHHIRARPSLIAKIRKADMLLCSGASLEVGWLPILLQKSSNSQIQPDKIGYIMAADYVPMLEASQSIDRSLGDTHPEGNPHLHLNPHNISIIAKVLTERFILIDPKNTHSYKYNFNVFNMRWQKAIKEWEEKAAPLKGKNYIPHHRNWSYLADWIGMHKIIALEPKPGIPPTTNHLKSILTTVSSTPIDFIIRTPYANGDGAEWLHKKSGIASFVLPYTIGGNPESTDLFKLFDSTLNMLLENQHD